MTFSPIDKDPQRRKYSGHDPAGAAPFKGKMGQPMTVKFSTPGSMATSARRTTEWAWLAS